LKYNLAVKEESEAATAYLFELAEKQSLVEVKKLSPKRSLSQNNYLHLLLGAFGTHFGYTLEESKAIYKEINSDIYLYSKKNRAFFKSSADISKEDMAKSIDNFMKKSEEAGYPLPLATDQDWLREISNQIERERYFQ
jgi:hypothetical protein